MGSPTSHTDADLFRLRLAELEVALEMRRTRCELVKLVCEDRELLAALHGGRIVRVKALLARVSKTLAASKEALAEPLQNSV